jgi:hypothetical protein
MSNDISFTEPGQNQVRQKGWKVMDHTKIEYVLSADDTDFDIIARLDGLRVGWAKCIREGDRLILADLRLETDVSPPWPVFQSLLLSWFGRRKGWQLSRCGIGTALLKRLLFEADAAGIREIKGSVMTDAIRTQPWLLPWYEKHGFRVIEPDADAVRGAAKMIICRHRLP